ncbi:MAG: hypothetical protein U9N14_06975 [Pseudomonadota bacterium]|nr:hypothetical protein [Pseudomonadota bacterium]
MTSKTHRRTTIILVALALTAMIGRASMAETFILRRSIEDMFHYLRGLDDVNNNLAPKDGQVLVYDGNDKQWTSGFMVGAWPNRGGDIFYNGGRVGIGTGDPQTLLDVNGPIRIGHDDKTIESSGNITPEAYLIVSEDCNEDTRGKIMLKRPSANSIRDHLCFCGDFEGLPRWVCIGG